MSVNLRQSTAGQVIHLGPIVAASDGTTAYTSSILNTEIKLAKHNATSEVSKNSGGSTHIAGGRHYATFDATDSNTVGRLKITVAAASQLQWWINCRVLPANVYDALELGPASDLLDVNIVSVNESISAAQNVQRAGDVIAIGSAIAGTLSTTQATTSLGATYATNDQLKGLQIKWEGNVTAALTGQGSLVTAYDGATRKLTYNIMTTAPAVGDRFVVF